MKSTLILEYGRRQPRPIPSGPLEPGILMNISALIGLVVGTGAITTVILSGRSAIDSDWELFKTSMLIILPGILLAMEYRAYFRNSVIASTIVGMAFLMLDLLMLVFLSGHVDSITNQYSAGDLVVILTHFVVILMPFAVGLFAAWGHFAWARRLERYSDASASQE